MFLVSATDSPPPSYQLSPATKHKQQAFLIRLKEESYSSPRWTREELQSVRALTINTLMSLFITEAKRCRLHLSNRKSMGLLHVPVLRAEVKCSSKTSVALPRTNKAFFMKRKGSLTSDQL